MSVEIEDVNTTDYNVIYYMNDIYTKINCIIRSYSNNTDIFEANERYSSRLCSKCRFINKSDILETKICKNCGSTLDRDINAAKNIYHMNIHLLDD